MYYDRKQMEEFFGSVRRASLEVFSDYRLPNVRAGKTRPWIERWPIGITEHYTAGISWKSTVRWLNGSGTKNSCHFLILDRKVERIDGIFADHGINFPVSVLMLSDLHVGTNHGTWTNGYNIGIENRNAGVLEGIEGDWRWWPRNWTAKFPHKELGKTPINIDGIWWEPYTYWQIVTNITLGQMLYCLYEGELDKRWFLPHQCVSAAKYDTGRAFPLNNVRDAVFNLTDIYNLDWLSGFKENSMYMDDYDEEDDEYFLDGLAERQGNRAKDSRKCMHMAERRALQTPACAELELLVKDGPYRFELPAIRRAYNLLGYHVTPNTHRHMDHDTTLATWMFQKSAGLKVDRIPGNKETQPALFKRLMEFGLHMGRA